MNKTKKILVSIMCGNSFGMSLLTFVPKGNRNLSEEMKKVADKENIELGLISLTCAKKAEDVFVLFDVEIKNAEDVVATLVFKPNIEDYEKIKNAFGEEKLLRDVENGVEAVKSIKALIENYPPSLYLKNRYTIK